MHLRHRGEGKKNAQIIDNLLGRFSRLPRDILDEDIGGMNAIASIGGCDRAYTHLILYQVDAEAAELEGETVTTPASIRPLRNAFADDEAVRHSHCQNRH